MDANSANFGNSMSIVVKSLADSSAVNNMKITVVEGAVGTTSTSAAYDDTYAVGGATGQLTITLANNSVVTALQVQNALNTMSANTATFSSKFSVVANGAGASGQSITTPATAGTTPVSVAGATTGGANRRPCDYQQHRAR